MHSATSSQAFNHLRLPSRAQLAKYAESVGIPPSDSDIDSSIQQAAELLDDFQRLDALGEPDGNVRYPDRDAGRPPTEAEDPFNALIRVCEVNDASSGPLSGMRVGVKDAIPIAGVPMTGGTARHDPPVPAEDAPVIARLLEAWARITATTNIAGSAFGEACAPFGLVAEFLRYQSARASYVARTHNLVVEFRRQIDRALTDVDVMITPTTALGPYELTEYSSAAAMPRDPLNRCIRNTVPCNLTGHPALSVPADSGDNDLPNGLQIIGRWFDEHTIYRAAFAFEGSTQ